MILKKTMLGLAAGLLAALPGVAAAQDASQDGFYLGLNAGYRQNTVDWTYHDPGGGFPDRPIGDQDAEDVTIGVHGGWNHNFGSLLLGVEVSVAAGVMSDWGSTSCFNPAYDCEARADGSLVMAGVRGGWAPSDRWLVYASGGYAQTGFETREVFVATGAVGFPTHGEVNGHYLGLGVEWGLSERFTLGAEYIHYDFEEETQLSTTASEHRNIDADSDALRFRISRRIG